MVKPNKTDPLPDIRYADPSHEAFNESRKLTPTPNPFDGPWIKPETLARLPNVSREFQMNRDPFIAMQQLDLDRAARQQGETGRGSAMVGKDKPRMDHKPPPEMRRTVDRSEFSKAWLVEQRAAAMENAKPIRRSRDGPEHIFQQTPRRTPER